MRKTALIAATAAALFGAMPATAQSSFMPSVIGQAVMNSMNQGYPSKCYQGTGMYKTTPASLESGSRRSELAMQDYLQLAAAGTSLQQAFSGKNIDLNIDGIGVNPSAARDPNAVNVVRLERVGLVVGYSNNRFRGLWRALAADGQVIGTYDAYLRRAKDKSRIIALKFFSPTSSAKPEPMHPFCDELGDIEKWQSAKAEREAKKAAKKAARAGRTDSN